MGRAETNYLLIISMKPLKTPGHDHLNLTNLMQYISSISNLSLYLILFFICIS